MVIKNQFVSVDELNAAIEKTIGVKGFNLLNIGCSSPIRLEKILNTL